MCLYIVSKDKESYLLSKIALFHTKLMRLQYFHGKEGLSIRMFSLLI